MQPLTFPEARALIIDTVRAARPALGVEEADLLAANGRILAEDIRADRDSPAISRSVRDGFALRASDTPGVLRIIGESRAGGRFPGTVAYGETVEIMTGAPVPDGADAIVMVEHVEKDGERVRVPKAEAKQFINYQGCEAAADEIVMHAGQRIDYTEIAMLASFGRRKVKVCRKPVVSIVATGDEIVGVEEKPAEHQIRNSNAYSLAAQVARAGGNPRILPVARDTMEATETAIANGLRSDLLLISGGVSAGKYDVVEDALANFGARILFRPRAHPTGATAGVRFGARSKFFFGLPGNPSSTMITFEVFARAALELAGGGHGDLAAHAARPADQANSGTAPGSRDFCQRGSMRMAPKSRRSRWQGSGDVPAITRANAYLVADPTSPSTRPANRSACCQNRNAPMKALPLRRAPASPHGRCFRARPRLSAAHARTRLSHDAPKVLEQLPRNPKGDPLEIARIAGITAAKRTSDLIPLCHPLPLSHADVDVTVEKDGVRIVASARTTAQTGVEMEALTAASVAALTVYDMTKALDKGIEIQDLYLLEKTGGKSGDYRRPRRGRRRNDSRRRVDHQRLRQRRVAAPTKAVPRCVNGWNNWAGKSLLPKSSLMRQPRSAAAWQHWPMADVWLRFSLPAARASRSAM